MVFLEFFFLIKKKSVQKVKFENMISLLGWMLLEVLGVLYKRV
jgi:hypothetical protein